MVIFPNCKINLGLHILQKRADGFHNLETIFYPLPFFDVLEIIQNPSPATGIEFSSSGLLIDGDTSNNSCVKAYHLLQTMVPQLPAVKMHLHKAIPLGAGLGGGSADGALTLRLLNIKFNLGLSNETLAAFALQLGSDAPFFLQNVPCHAGGRGEILEPLAVDLAAYQIVLINPGIHINTGWAFSKIVPSANRPSLKAIITQPIEDWKETLTNDFEEAIFSQHPEIKSIKQMLYDSSAIYAAMSGSGATVFGIFKKDKPPTLSFPPHYFVKIM